MPRKGRHFSASRMTSVPGLETEVQGCQESRSKAFAVSGPGSNKLRDAARSASSTMHWWGISSAGDISGLDPILNFVTSGKVLKPASCRCSIERATADGLWQQHGLQDHTVASLQLAYHVHRGHPPGQG